MTAPDVTAIGDPFGATRTERLQRRFAGAGSATLLMVGALGWWVPVIPLIACAAIYVFGIPLSLLLEQRWPTRPGRSPVPRYMALGAVVGLGIAFGLAVPTLSSPEGSLGWAAIFGVITVPSGAIAGGVTAWAARRLPDRWLLRVAIGGVVGAVAITLTVTVSRLS